MMKHHSVKTRFLLIGTLIFGLALIGSLFAWPLMQVQAGPTLPPRNTATPLPPGNGDGDDGGSSGPLLAYIELQAANVPGGAWGTVQWQDADGNWHDVEGWRGVLGAGGHQRWTVEAKDFNTGPFRWQVRQGMDGMTLGTSESFILPAGANQTIQVHVSSGS